MSRPALALESLELEKPYWNSKIRLVHDWWHSASNALGKLPGRKDVDPLALRETLPILWMLDVSRPELRFRYRLVGTCMCFALGRDPTGEWLDQSPSRGERWFEAATRYRAAAMTGTPAWRKGPPRFEHDARFGLVETVVLPLATDGVSVDVLLCASMFYGMNGIAVA
jgi:hypothetical protein